MLRDLDEGVTSSGAGAASISDQRELSCKNIYYAITVKPVIKDKVYYQCDIEKVIKQRLRRFTFYKVAWENDSSHVLHFHALADGASTINYKLIHLYGWHIWIRPLKTTVDKLKWEDYIGKRNSEEEILRHLSYHNNLFLEID